MIYYSHAALEWLSKNLEIIGSFSYSSANSLMMKFSADEWRVGYSYFEDYEGDYFYSDLVGAAKLFSEAIEQCYRKTLPVVELMRNVMALPRPIDFVEKQVYTIVSLGSTGDLIFDDIEFEQEYDKRKCFVTMLGARHLYDSFDCRRIYYRIDENGCRCSRTR